MATHIPFRDRRHAGIVLRRALRKRGIRSPFVVAIGRGGVPVGRAICDELGGVLTMLSVKKVTDAGGRTIGAVASDGTAYLHDESIAGAGQSDVAQQVAKAGAIAASDQAAYAGEWKAVMAGRPVIVVDDAVATGATAAAAIGAVRGAGPVLVIFAAPVGTLAGLELIGPLADELVTIHSTHAFQALNEVYSDHPPVSDAELAEMLAGT